ncbi:MAG: LamG domain-containing protein, partial [Acidobacteriota bacterium]
ECLSAGDSAPLDRQYCDTDLFPDGCVRRWHDQSSYRPESVGPRPPWPTGRDLGQAGLDKPGLIDDCLAGHPCLRGGKGVVRDRTLELPADQTAGPVAGAFSLFLLVRPVGQAEDFFYFGHGGTELIHRVADDSLHLRGGSRPPVPLTEPGSMTAEAWHLIEIHRNARGDARGLVDGWDRTTGQPRVRGEVSWRYLMSVSGGRGSHGDLAAFLLVDRRLAEHEQQTVRRYLASLYDLSIGDGSPPPIDDAVDIDRRLALFWSFDRDDGCRSSGWRGLPPGELLGCPRGGPIPVPGMIDRALQFDGENDGVRAVESTIDLDHPYRLSVSLWLRAGRHDDWRALVDKRDALEDGWDLYVSPAGRAFLRVDGTVLEGASIIADDRWHHVAGVYDREGLRLYVDGRLDRSAPLERPKSLDTRALVIVGRGFDDRYAFDGVLDEVRVYGRALSAPEIAVLATRP